ncbi:MAG: hypothetical protein JSS60_09040 [Verrucomicrobia bacterium]|nr:hypothetical protein [Verrucomicrobiota bacterium]
MFCKLLASALLMLFSFVRVVEGSEPAAQQDYREGWVAYATPNYFSILEVMIASVHAFSTHPIVAVGVNADIPFSTEKYPRLIKKRIDVDLANRSPYLYKPQAILASGLDSGIYIDADVILNKNCDELFKNAALVKDYPLCPLHENDAYVSWEAMEFFGLSERSMHYVHADMIVFSKECQPFLKEWCDTCLNYPWLGSPCYDETLLNVILWKTGATTHLPTIDPYNAYFANYLTLSSEQIQQLPYSHWFLFHGNKDPGRGWDMLRSLQEKHSGN